MTETKRGPADTNKSPSYPQRVHIRERPELQQVLRSWEERIDKAGQALAQKADSPDRSHLERLYFQMLGARDQLADAVRRLPMEVGNLYEEDHLKLEEATSSLERLMRRWE